MPPPSPARAGEGNALYRPPDRLADLADDSAPEQQHAGDENGALDHRDPLSELREIVLHRDDDDRAHDGAIERAHAAQQRHQYDFARRRETDVGQRGVLHHDRLVAPASPASEAERTNATSF